MKDFRRAGSQEVPSSGVSAMFSPDLEDIRNPGNSEMQKSGRQLVQLPRSAARRWMFRVASILAGLSLFAAFEALCIVAGWGRAGAAEDPFVGFTSVRPLFELTADGSSFHTASYRRGFFKEDSFTAQKPAGEFRIFVFGGSTVQGNPFSIETSFPTYLQVALERADPRHSWNVVNCGGVSYASYRLLPVMQECLGYEPDLFIFCEGHNEFLEDVSYADIRMTATVALESYSLLSRLRSFRLLRRVINGQLSNRDDSSASGDVSQSPVLATEVDTLLDHEGGLAAYHRDDQHAANVQMHFRSNLDRMIELCDSQAVPLLMILPPSNLSDCPPFKSEYSEATSAEDRIQIQALLKQARIETAQNVRQAISIVQNAIAIDPRFAFSWYELGQLQFSAGDNTSASFSFRTARDEDICPLRMTTPLEIAMRDAAEAGRVPLIDAHTLLQSRCPSGIVGQNVLVDHVHPSFRGHEDIAIAVTEWMLSEGFATVVNNGWKEAMRTDCAVRLQSLSDLYFLRGRRALETLKLWAAGRSDGAPLRKTSP